MGAIIAILFIGDHPQLFSRSRHQIMRLDTAYTDEAALRTDLETMLSGKIRRLQIQRVDLVNNSTVVDVRYTSDAGTSSND